MLNQLTKTPRTAKTAIAATRIFLCRHASGNGQVAIIAAPTYPVLTSTNLNPGTIIVLALPAFVSAVDGHCSGSYNNEANS
jgi:hypothetical protein